MDKVILTAVCLLFNRRASGEGLPEPQNVHFYSFNLRNMVRWTPSVNDTVIYTVEYAVYGDAEESNSEQVRWRSVEQCTSIQQTECDVSLETFNLQEEYYARVKAVSAHDQSQWTESITRFRPMVDTILGPPLVELNVMQNYINITMKGPFRWKTKKTKKEKSLWKIFPYMMYNVSVYNSKSKHMSFSLQTSTHTLGPLDFSTQVCVVVQAQSQSLPLVSKPSEHTCAETPKDVFRDQLLAAMLGGVLPSALCVCILAVLGGLVHCYITDHKQPLPNSTDLFHDSKKSQMLQPNVPQTIIVNVIHLGGEESKPISLVPQLLPISEEALSVGGAHLAPPPPVKPPSSYAQQNVSVPGGSADELAVDSQSGWSETDGSEPQPWESQHDDAGDYGIVLPATVEPQGPCLYRSQVNTIEPMPLDDEDHEEEMQIFLDWNPDTRELKIPLMGLMDVEDGEQTDTEADEVTLLPKVILRQCSEESSEHEDDFIKMERNWGLIIHSNPD